MNSVCASAVQTTPSTSEQRDLARAERRRAAPPPASANGSSTSAAQSVLPERDVGRPAACAASARLRTASSAKVKPGDDAPRKPATVRLASENSGTSSTSPPTTSAAVDAVAPAPAAPEQRALQQQHEQRKAREAEQPDRDVGDLDRREERDPVQRQHHAVGERARQSNGADASRRASRTSAERHGGDRRCARARSPPATGRATCRTGRRSRTAAPPRAAASERARASHDRRRQRVAHGPRLCHPRAACRLR